VPNAPSGVREGVSLSPPEEGCGDAARPLPVKMEHFSAVFKLDLTEETSAHLQEEEAIARSCLILATHMAARWLFLPARRYASAGLCDSDVSVRLSVGPSVTRR